jgi:hypothetical protein
MNTKVSPTWMFYIAIGCVFGLGLIMRFLLPHYLLATHVETFRGVGEAFIVAALLAAIVDPYVKFRLGKEIGREIAREVVGQYLPKKLRESLEKIQDIQLYLQRMVIDARLESVESKPHLLKWSMTMHYEVENASWNPLPFVHRFDITDEETDKAEMKLTEVSHYLNGESQYRLKNTDPEFKKMCENQPGIILFAYKTPTHIRSTRLGVIDKCEYFTSTERLVNVSEIQIIQLSLATIGVTLTVRHPRDVKIETSLEHIDDISPECPEGESGELVSRWKSNRAYLVNEHVWIMYERPNLGLEQVPPLAPAAPASPQNLDRGPGYQ